MPRYFFHLKDGGRGYVDMAGITLENDAAAVRHSQEIAADLLKNRERKTRYWRVNVCNAQGEQIYQSRLIDQDQIFNYVNAPLQKKIEEWYRYHLALQETLETSYRLTQQSRALIARCRGKAHLVIADGKPL